MKERTVCFVQHASEHPLFLALASTLEEQGYRSFFACKTKTAHEAYTQAGRKAFFVTSEAFSDALVTDGEKQRIEATYGKGILQRVVTSDIHLGLLFPADTKKQEDVVARAFLYWEHLLETETVDCVVGRETATFLTRPAYFVAKKRDIPYGQLILGPGAGLCLLCDVGELHIWQELQTVLGAGVFQLSVEQKKQVDDFVQVRLPKVTDKMSMRFVPTSLWKTLKQYVGLWRHDTKVARMRDPLYVAALRYGRYRLRKQLQWKYLTDRLFTYAEVDEADTIVYFPIYSGLETSYLTHTPFWATREVELILTVARALPAGCTLYIKEHPHNPGDLSFLELRRLAREPNIKVVRPWVASQYLITKSQLVVVIQGTAGWEAFLAKKTVLCIEDVAFYGRSSLVYKVTDITQLKTSIAEALAKGTSHYTTQEALWYWFIFAILQTAGRGEIINLKPPFGGFVTDPLNVAQVTDFLVEKFNRVLRD